MSAYLKERKGNFPWRPTEEEKSILHCPLKSFYFHIVSSPSHCFAMEGRPMAKNMEARQPESESRRVGFPVSRLEIMIASTSSLVERAP